MPIVRIEIYKGFSKEYKKGILEAIHEALVSAFKIPDEDRNQIIYEHDEENFERQPGKSRHFTIIEITAFHGRSDEAKRRLYNEIVTRLSKNPGIDPQDTLIALVDPEPRNWGVQGGQAADQVKLGFKIDV